ncbi:DUF4214 domain-containing protein [Diaminobutyricimonas sp. TR449]|uniref:DUF4214 domain-containing protein n=1 Tax=Diaminobutyricimonas sp. TR449 TaxID=2708076 RepID=UPI001421253E|nr:DUF4214 domain-containing protein [Diaminobutyricimonas sp. TR449]
MKTFGAAALTAMIGTLLAVAPTTSAQAATASDFDPGYIISDDIFFDEGAMSESAIQAFLDGRSGVLKTYRQDTTSKPSSPRCSGYEGATQESAARIIFKVAQACGINPQVILVTLEKETSMITRSNPEAWRFDRAMGYYCPDDPNNPGWCNPTFAGFFNQVYNASAQFQRYTQNPGDYAYKIGLSTVKYSPRASCDVGTVNIRNQATANLYIYTPYQPNDAAMANLYGSAPASHPNAPCASYGNRNFWVLFTDWFGKPNPPAGADKFVTAIYQDILGRKPDPSGLTTWVRTVNTTGNRTIVSDSILTSFEYRLSRIDQAYNEILARGADPAGHNTWLTLTGNGTVRIDEVTLVFVESDEYFIRLGSSNRNFIDAVYQRYLGRSAGDSEIAHWEPLIASSGRGGVTRAIYGSVESAQGRIAGLYNKYLGRGLDPAGLNTWTPIIQSRGDNAIRSGIVSSEEYWLKAQTR